MSPTSNASQAAEATAASVPAAGGVRMELVAALIVWFLLGLGIIGVIVFGGYEGRPVEDLNAMNPLKHHAVFGPAFLVWVALSAMGGPRLLRATFNRN